MYVGLWHPDDMSAFLMTCWWRHVRNIPLEIDEQVDYYKEYYKEYWIEALGVDGVTKAIKESRESA